MSRGLVIGLLSFPDGAHTESVVAVPDGGDIRKAIDRLVRELPEGVRKPAALWFAPLLEGGEPKGSSKYLAGYGNLCLVWWKRAHIEGA